MEIDSCYEQGLRSDLTTSLAEISEKMNRMVEQYFSGMLAASEHREDGYSHPHSEVLADIRNVEESIVAGVQFASKTRLEGFENRLSDWLSHLFIIF